VTTGCLASLATPWPASGVAEKPVGGSSFIVQRSSFIVSPNPFVGLARIPGHETAYFRVYDAQGRRVALNPGHRLGDGLAPGVYLVRDTESSSPPVRVVKLR
jgi:hypothetical protein